MKKKDSKLDKIRSKALALDKEIRAQWGLVKKSARALGKLFSKMQDGNLHTYISKPGSRVGYPRFEEYVESVVGPISKGNVFRFMKIASLTEGKNALSEDDVDAMPSENAYHLSRLKPEQRTATIIKAARTEPIKKFVPRVQEQLNVGKSPDEQLPEKVDFYRKLAKPVADKLEATIESALLLPIVKDGDRSLTLQEKAIHAICCGFETSYQEELAEALRQQELDNAAQTKTIEKRQAAEAEEVPEPDEDEEEYGHSALDEDDEDDDDDDFVDDQIEY